MFTFKRFFHSMMWYAGRGNWMNRKMKVAKENWKISFSFFNFIIIIILVGFAIHSHESAMGIHVFPILSLPLTSRPIPTFRVIQCIIPLSTLPHASNLDWQSISYMVIYMFQCYSLKSSHPRPLPQSSKDCSIFIFVSFAVSHIGSLLPSF